MSTWLAAGILGCLTSATVGALWAAFWVWGAVLRDEL